MLHASFASQVQQCIAKPGFCVAIRDAISSKLRPAKATGKKVKISCRRTGAHKQELKKETVLYECAVIVHVACVHAARTVSNSC